jgi:putative transposase
LLGSPHRLWMGQGFRTVGTNGDAEYWAISRLDLTIPDTTFHALDPWQIEVYHRGLKQFTGVEL